MRIEHHLAPNRFLITLVFETVETGGVEHSFEIVRDALPIRFGKQSPPAGFNMLRSMQTLTFPVRENRVVVPNGYRSSWRTRGVTTP
jgi:hypothetical protein